MARRIATRVKSPVRSFCAKLSLPGFLLGLAACVLLVPAKSAQAGCVILSDKHGAYSMYYGTQSKQELVSKANTALRKVSKHPKDIYIYFHTTNHGYGTILRFKDKGGKQSIVGIGGCATAKIARDRCVSTLNKKGIKQWTVAKTWLEE